MDPNGVHIEGLPTEVLEMIFLSLKGTDVIACRAVCRRWRDIIDAFSDNVWRHYALRDFRGNPEIAKNISNLTYKDLYQSLALWDKVEEATLTTIDMPSDPTFLVTDFKLLSNMRLGVTTQDLDNFDPRNMELSNAVRYFDIISMRYISCEYFEYDFHYYDENEKMIILLEEQIILHLIIKSNKKEKVCNLDEMPYIAYNIVCTSSDYVVFFNTNRVVCLAHVDAVNGEETIIIEELAVLTCNFLAFAFFNDKQIYILSQVNWTNFNIFRYEHDCFSLCDRIDNSTRSINLKLEEYGFEWSFPSIYECLYKSGFYGSEIMAHNHVVIKRRPGFRLNIYKRPYSENGDLKFNVLDQSPSRSIECLLRKRRPYFERSELPVVINGTRVEKIRLGVIEIKNGHRIVVYAKNSMSFLDLTHNIYNPLQSTQDENVTRKRRASSPHELSPSAKISKASYTI